MANMVNNFAWDNRDDFRLRLFPDHHRDLISDLGELDLLPKAEHDGSYLINDIFKIFDSGAEAHSGTVLSRVVHALLE